MWFENWTHRYCTSTPDLLSISSCGRRQGKEEEEAGQKRPRHCFWRSTPGRKWAAKESGASMEHLWAQYGEPHRTAKPQQVDISRDDQQTVFCDGFITDSEVPFWTVVYVFSWHMQLFDCVCDIVMVWVDHIMQPADCTPKANTLDKSLGFRQVP